MDYSTGNQRKGSKNICQQIISVTVVLQDGPDKKVFVRFHEDEIRGILSSQYGVLDNLQLVDMLLETIPEDTRTRVTISPKRMRLQLFMDEHGWVDPKDELDKYEGGL